VLDRIDLAVTKSVIATIEAEDDMAVRYVNFALIFPVGQGSTGFTVSATLKGPAQSGVSADKHGFWVANLTLVGFGNTPTGNASIELFIGDFSGNDVFYDTAALLRLGLKTHVFVFDSSLNPPTASNCGGRQCPPGNECCKDDELGPVCYSPQTHHCVASRRLCGILDSVCGEVCFNPKTHTCFGSLLCPINFQICRNQNEYACYNPSQYDCQNGMLLQRPQNIICGGKTCTGNQLCCGNKTCYDPTTETCCNVFESVNNPGPCPVNWNTGAAMQCCSSFFLGSPISCYDPLQQFCCVTASPGGSSATLCDASQTTFQCCGDRGFRIPV
jgi:hypothetical protein